MSADETRTGRGSGLYIAGGLVVIAALGGAAYWSMIEATPTCSKLEDLVINEMADIDHSDGSWSVSGPDPRVVFSVPEGDAEKCVLVEVGSEGADNVTVYLPEEAAPVDRWSEDRIIRHSVKAGRHTVIFVLPRYVSNRNVRVDPIGRGRAGLIIDRIGIGELIE